MREYAIKSFAEWDKAVEVFELRKRAITAWDIERLNKLKKNHELHGKTWEIEKKLMGGIYKKYDILFAAILKKYPIKTIHDFMAIDRESGIVGYKIASKIDRSAKAKHSADSGHNQPGGSHEKRAKLVKIWLTGKYKTKTECIEKECGKIGMSISTGGKALRNK